MTPIHGNGHRFLRKGGNKIRPTAQTISSTKLQSDASVDLPTSKSSNLKYNEYQDGNSRNPYPNIHGGTLNLGTKKRVQTSRSISNDKLANMLANIPICTTQKCLIKYGCSHC